MKTFLKILPLLAFTSFAASSAVAQTVVQSTRPANEIPMYGGTVEPGLEIDVANSTRKSELAWQLIERGNITSAIRLFNEAWLLNRDDPTPYWGFAYISGMRSQTENTLTELQNSIRFYNMARVRMGAPNANLLTDLAFAHTTLGAYREANNGDPRYDFQQAADLFEEVNRLNPEFGPMLLNYSFLEYFRGNYVRALQLAERAAAAGLAPDPEFLAELQGLAR